MCDHAPNREAAMVIIDPGTPGQKGRDGIWCDPCIEPLVRALNETGMRTVASCCGHGTHPTSVVLADGREVLVVDRETSNRIYDFLAGRGDQAQREVMYRVTLIESDEWSGLSTWTEDFKTYDEAEARITQVNAANTSPVAPAYWARAKKKIRAVRVVTPTGEATEQ